MNFDSYYDPPDDPPIAPESEEVYGLLEDAGVDESLIEKICVIIQKLADEVVAAGDCAQCERRAMEAEAQADREYEEYQNSRPLPDGGVCAHGIQYIDCNPCAIKEDLAYDAMRERRW